MVRVSKCCCCIPVKTGAYIIGCIHVLGMVIGLIQLDMIKVALDVFCGCTFLLMVFKDSEQKRLFYFAAYLVYTGIITVMHLIFAFWDKDEELKTNQTCTDLSLNSTGKKDPWEGTPYKDMEDCESKVRMYITIGTVFGMSVFFILQTHYVLVLYTHYKNALLIKSKGGCMPDPDSSDIVQMNNLPTFTSEID